MDEVQLRADRQTPFLSSLSDSGTVFKNATANAPWTLPSHASLFTGTTPSKHGAHAGHKHLDDSLTTLPEILQTHDYETVAVSNNTWISEEFGFGRGFETFFKTWQYVQADTDLGKIAQMENGLDMFKEAVKAVFDGNPITNISNAVYGQYFRRANDDGAARTNEWIKDWLTGRDDSRPFFLFVNYLEPHLEYRPPKAHTKQHLPEGITYGEAMEISQDAWGYIAGTVDLTDEDFEILRALYRAEISYLEEKIEALIHLLKSESEWDDTLFIVTGDHGENIGEHGLMDHQYALYDTLLHVPLYVHGGPFKDNDRTDLVQLIDIAPSILDTLDIDAPEVRNQFQGVSFHPDTEQSREYAVAEYMAPQPSMDALETKVGDLPDHVYEYDRSLKSIRTDRYKYIRGSDGSCELYDIQGDPGEQTNLAGTKLDIVERLDTMLDEWLNSFEQTERLEDVSMDDDTRSRLEDLGYLQ
ncbi:hypothetical protein GCM10009067_29030 [Haloarcula sebkhae]|nr:hypothetical protein GCM10009067_29030 [Haloarcula sebkhae]